jgi:hypothetical protein
LNQKLGLHIESGILLIAQQEIEMSDDHPQSYLTIYSLTKGSASNNDGDLIKIYSSLDDNKCFSVLTFTITKIFCAKLGFLNFRLSMIVKSGNMYMGKYKNIYVSTVSPAHSLDHLKDMVIFPTLMQVIHFQKS